MFVAMIIMISLLMATGIACAMCNPWKVLMNPPEMPEIEPLPEVDGVMVV